MTYVTYDSIPPTGISMKSASMKCASMGKCLHGFARESQTTPPASAVLLHRP